MAWGCKAENHPDGCGWANRLVWRGFGITEWWCDVCERDGNVVEPVSEEEARRKA